MTTSTPDIFNALEKLRVDLTYEGERSSSVMVQYPRVCARFLASVRMFPPTTDDVKLWINNLEAGQNTKRFHHYILKRLFEANHWTWDIRRPPVLPDDEEDPPTLDVETVDYLIEGADYLTAQQAAYLALSTVFGLRRGEMAQLGPDNFDHGHTLTVQTLKHGRKREHFIPDPIADYVAAYQFHPVDVSSLNKMFLRMFKTLAVDHPKGYGFHSVRSAVISGLSVNGVPDSLIFRFMGWKRRARSGLGFRRDDGTGMVGVYNRPEADQLHQIIYGNHPFLKSWEGR